MTDAVPFGVLYLYNPPLQWRLYTSQCAKCGREVGLAKLMDSTPPVSVPFDAITGPPEPGESVGFRPHICCPTEETEP